MNNSRLWDFIFGKWTVANGAKTVIFAVMKRGPGGWWPFGGGDDLKFQRLIEPGNKNPCDMEVIDVFFDSIGRLKEVQRYKIIHVEQGRSYDDLCRMLGVTKEELK